MLSRTLQAQQRRQGRGRQDQATALQPAAQPLTVSKGAGSAVALSWGSACNTTQYGLYWGSSPIGGGVSWSSSMCNVTGSFDPGSVPAGKFVYFVVVGQNGSYEGSYGKSSTGAELPHAAAPCKPQNLTGNCP